MITSPQRSISFWKQNCRRSGARIYVIANTCSNCHYSAQRKVAGQLIWTGSNRRDKKALSTLSLNEHLEFMLNSTTCQIEPDVRKTPEDSILTVTTANDSQILTNLLIPICFKSNFQFNFLIISKSPIFHKKYFM